MSDRTESKEVPMWLWKACSDEMEAIGWRVRGYQLEGRFSQPTSVILEREAHD